MSVRAGGRQLTWLIFAGSLILALSSVLAGAQSSDSLCWPLKDCRSLASSFGEYRPGHVHMGLDIRSRDSRDEIVTGKPVYAVGEGFIARIKVGAGGYGRALYLQMADGRMAVYAHLERFEPGLQRYLWDIQWDSLSYEQDFFLPSDKFVFKRGEIIAYSGQSGAKLPHLHFEIRSPQGTALNPLAQGFPVQDTTPPIFCKFAIIPLTPNSEVDADCKPLTYRTLQSRQGFYYVPSRPKIWGKIGLAVDCYDRTDAAPNPVAAYALELSFNQETIFSVRYDSCDYFSYGQIEIDRDPYLNRQGAGIFSRLFHSEGCELPFYTGQGIIDSGEYPPGIYEYTVQAQDYSGNSVMLTGKVQLLGEGQIPASERRDNFDITAASMDSQASALFNCPPEFYADYIRFTTTADNPQLFWANAALLKLNFTAGKGEKIARLDYSGGTGGKGMLLDASGRMLDAYEIAPIYPSSGGQLSSPDGDLTLIFPAGGVYDTMYAALKEMDLPPLNGDIEPASVRAYRLEPQWLPLKRAALIKWRLQPAAPQAGIYYLNGAGKPIFLGSDSNAEGVQAVCGNLETLVLLYDRQPPEVRLIKPNIANPLRQNNPVFHFAVSDDLSGIEGRSIQGEIDGTWVLTEYDPPRNAIYTYLRQPFDPGRHSIIITAADKSGNRTEQEYNFSVTVK